MLSRTTPSSPRRLFRAWHRLTVLALLVLTGFAVPLAAQPCPTGVEEVAVDLVRDGSGLPVLHEDDTERREHAFVSDTLADALGIVVPTDPDAEIFPQIRVLVPQPLLSNGLVSSAVFSVVGTFDDPDLELEIFAENREDEPLEIDEESGFFKLFEDNSSVNLATIEVTVHAVAPGSTTTVTNGGTPVVTEHFCEPNSLYGFEEHVRLESDDRFALLVPHGGEIEQGTSEQIATLQNVLDTEYGVDANVWEARAVWIDSAASEHFHITSDAIEPASFPGLAAVEAQSDFDATEGIDFQYAVSLHGFGNYDGNGLVIGGRAHREEKCFVARTIQQRLAAYSLDEVAYYIWDLDNNDSNNIDLPDARDITITDERGDEVGLSGTDSQNIVNRLSFNDDGDAGWGGFQIEQSRPLRDNLTYRTLVAEEIARAIGELIANPSLIDPNSTAICDALVAGPEAPEGVIHGTVWQDVNDDDVRQGGEPILTGVQVELREGGVVIAQTVTDGDGAYLFDNLAGDYQVRVVGPSAYTFAQPNVGSDASDSDVDTFGLSAVVAIAFDGELVLDAGLDPVGSDTGGSIGDLAWLDVDVEDGLQQPSEPGLDGVTVELFAADGTFLALTTTVDGAYLFEHLAAGSYSLRFTPPAGYERVPQVVGFPDDDSDADSTTGETVDFTLAANASDASRDAGFRVNCFDVALVAFASEWRARTTTGNLSSSWTQASFVENGWTEHQATLGYPASGVTSGSPNTGITSHFRLAFTVDDPSLFDTLTVSLFREDGAVVYLNGQEVLRSNLPAGTITSTTAALAHSRTTVTAAIDEDLLVAGTNQLAVEVHKRASGDTVLAFDLELTAKVCRPCVHQVERVTSRDTFLDSSDSSEINGDEEELEMDGSPEKNVLLGWSLADLPDDAEVLHAELEVSVTDSATQSYRIYPLLRSWSENATHWQDSNTEILGEDWQVDGAKGSNDSDRATPVGLVRFPDEVLGTVVLNVSGRELVENWFDGSFANHGVIIPGELSNQGGLDIESNDTEEENPPLLRVIYASCGE